LFGDLPRIDKVPGILRGTFSLAIGAIVARASGLFASVYTAWCVGPAEFGRYGIIRGCVDLFIAIAAVRLGATSIKFVAQFREKDPEKAGRILVAAVLFAAFSSLAISLLLGLSAHWFAVHWFNDESLTNTVRLAAALVLFMTLASVLEVSLAGFEAFDEIMHLNLIRALLTIGGACLLVNQYGINGLFGLNILVGAITSVLAYRQLIKQCGKHGVPIQYSMAPLSRESDALIHFSLPSILSGLIQTGSTFLSRKWLFDLPTGAVAMGLFDGAYQFRSMIMFLPNLFVKALLPRLSRFAPESAIRSTASLRRSTSPLPEPSSSSDQHDDRFDQMVSINVFANLLCLPPIVFGMILFGDQILAVLGTKYEPSAAVLPWIAIAFFFRGLTSSMRRVLDSLGLRWSTLVVQMTWAIVLLIGAGFWTSRELSVGLAKSFLVAEGWQVIATYAQVKLRLNIGVFGNHRLFACITTGAVAMLAAVLPWTDTDTFRQLTLIVGLIWFVASLNAMLPNSFLQIACGGMRWVLLLGNRVYKVPRIRPLVGIYTLVRAFRNEQFKVRDLERLQWARGREVFMVALRCLWLGFIHNRREQLRWRQDPNPKRCPVLFSIPWILTVMPRADLDQSTFDRRIYKASHRLTDREKEQSDPLELVAKDLNPNNVARYQGRRVCIDYGSPVDPASSDDDSSVLLRGEGR